MDDIDKVLACHLRDAHSGGIPKSYFEVRDSSDKIDIYADAKVGINDCSEKVLLLSLAKRTEMEEDEIQQVENQHTFFLRFQAANQIWPSAIALVDFFIKSETRRRVMDSSPKNLNFLELGCGLGATLLLISQLIPSFETAILTDFGDIVTHCKKNIDRNINSEEHFFLHDQCSNVFAMNYDWSSEKLEENTEEVLSKYFLSKNDGDSKNLVVVCADCVHIPLYGRECLDMLCQTLEILFKKAVEKFEKVQIFLSVENRSVDDGVTEFHQFLSGSKNLWEFRDWSAESQNPILIFELSNEVE